MAHFAKLDGNNIVTFVTVGRDEDNEQELTERTGDVYKQTSYNGNIRKNYAGIGYTYDEQRDAFIAPKPFNSWILNEDTCQWEAPVAYPSDVPEGALYIWNEDIQNWQLIDNQI
jgi:hypothetical protein